ncbi:MAG: hypothetical protein KGI69_04125 [Patescibacteria group bacterium]|nr:hypothetical protein [Patescibacteria group bacterium]
MENNTTKLPGPIALASSAWKLFKEHAGPLASIALIPYAGLYISNLAAFAGTPLLSIIALLGILASFAAFVAAQGALVSAVHAAASSPGSPISVGERYRFGFRRFWPFVFLIVLLIPIALGSTVLFVIPYAVVGVYMSFYTFTLFLDDKRGFSAFTESYRLVKGHWWAVFGRLAAMVAIVLVVDAAGSGLSALVLALIHHTADGDVVRYAVASLVSMAVGALVLPFAVSYLYGLYAALKASAAEAPTKAFRDWLVAFLVIGVIVAVALIAIIPAIAVFLLSKGADKAWIAAEYARTAVVAGQATSTVVAH